MKVEEICSENVILRLSLEELLRIYSIASEMRHGLRRSELTAPAEEKDFVEALVVLQGAVGDIVHQIREFASDRGPE
jgi:hypothetical protein